MLKINNRFFVLFILIIIIFFSLYLSGCNQPEPPKVVLSEESWHYGEVTPDKKPAHSFTIKNEGEEKLIIESVFSSCACVMLDLGGKEIAPGEATTLTATFDPYGYEGEISKTITIKSNDPENPEKKIEVSIAVQHVPNPDIEITPKTFNLGEMDSTSEKEYIIQFTISNGGDADLVIKEIVKEDIFSYQMEIPLTIKPGEQIQAEIYLDTAQLKKGEFRKAVRIMTNDPQNQAVFLRITGKIN